MHWYPPGGKLCLRHVIIVQQGKILPPPEIFSCSTLADLSFQGPSPASVLVCLQPVPGGWYAWVSRWSTVVHHPGSKEPANVVWAFGRAGLGVWGSQAACRRCMQVHHELIRGLIKEHDLYEVKTVGTRGLPEPCIIPTNCIPFYTLG